MLSIEDNAKKAIERLKETRYRSGTDWDGKWWSWNELGDLLVHHSLTICDHYQHANAATAKLREVLHDLLGPFDGRDPETDGPIDLETSGAWIRKAQAVLAEVE